VYRICYGLDDDRIVVMFPAVARYYSLLRNVQIGSGVHPAAYLTDIVDDIVTRLQAARPRYSSLIPGSGKILLSSPERPACV
jgi:hypothetical protein